MVSAVVGGTVAELIGADEGLAEVEWAYKERIAAAQGLIAAQDASSLPWPPDLPRPSANRDALDAVQYKAAFDLTCLKG